MTHRHKLSFSEIDKTTVQIVIVYENGESDTFELGGLPPDEAKRRAMINHFFASQIVGYEHKALTARLVELRAEVEAQATREAEPITPSSPPFLAELLIASLAPANSAQAQLGDLQEMFEKNVARIGERQARRKYWIEVARSFGPLLWQGLKRIGAFTVLIDYFRSKFGL